jgi:hypothetical protein
MTACIQKAPLSLSPALLILYAEQAGNLERNDGYGLRNVRWASLSDSQIPRILACKVLPMCDLNLNRPATPLHDAHQGGCFMYASWNKGGRL